MEELDRGNRPPGGSVLSIFDAVVGMLALQAGGVAAMGQTTITVHGYCVINGVKAGASGVMLVALGIVASVTAWRMWSGKRWGSDLGIITGVMGDNFGHFPDSSWSVIRMVGLAVNLYVQRHLWRPTSRRTSWLARPGLRFERTPSS